MITNTNNCTELIIDCTGYTDGSERLKKLVIKYQSKTTDSLNKLWHNLSMKSIYFDLTQEEIQEQSDIDF